RIFISAAVVILDHLFQRRDAAIVHIRRALGDLSKGRCLEVTFSRSNVSEFAVAPSDASVMQPFVGEVRTDVARRAAAFAADDPEALLLLGLKTAFWGVLGVCGELVCELHSV